MFGDEKQHTWKWMPWICIVVALLFLFFDPFGMEDIKIRYFVTVAPTVGPPGPINNNPPGGGGPIIAQAVGDVGNQYPTAATAGPRTPPSKVWPAAGNGTWINIDRDADGFIFNGCVRTTKRGIKITNSEIRGNCVTAQLLDEGGEGSFEYNAIYDVGEHGAAAAGCGRNSRFFRNHIKGGAAGVDGKTNCQVLENYIHDLTESSAADRLANSGVQISAKEVTGMRIEKNTFENTCGESEAAGQGCAGAVVIGAGASGNTVEDNYVKRWDGPTAGFIFNVKDAGKNTIRDNIVECANIAGFGVESGGTSTFTGNTSCQKKAS